MTAATTGGGNAPYSRKPFVVSLIGVVLVFLVIGLLIAAFGTGANRPEGVAERWLVAVGDTERKGVRERSRGEAEKVGPVALAAHLLPDEDTGGKSAFVDLEVGKAVDVDGDGKGVPFRLTQRQGSGVGDPIEGTLVLEQVDDEWKVVEVAEATPGLKVPSEGGAPAAAAPWGLYVGAVVVACFLTAGCVVLVRLASRNLDSA